MWKAIVLIAIIAAISQHAVRLYFVLNYEKSDVCYRHAPGPCVELEGAEGGSEDLTVLPNGLVFISSGFSPKSKGRILLLDLNDPQRKITELKIIGAKFSMSDFIPHGLSVWIDSKSGEITLMVVNHLPDKDEVEVFKFREETKSLTFVKSISSPDWGFMNDLTMTSENTFYITKMLNFRLPLLQKLELYLLLRLGEVMYYDGTNVKSVAGGLLSPNGINMSPDLRFLYVAENSKFRVKSYKRLKGNDLEFLEDRFLDTVPDNIEVDQATGDLWIGCHPRFHQIIQHSFTHGKTITPSQVLKVSTEEGRFTDTVEVFLDPGTRMTGSTVASVYKGRMIGGTLYSQLLLCDIIHSE